MRVDASEHEREAMRIADQRYADHYEPQRTWLSFFGFVLLCLGLYLVSLIEAVRAQLRIGSLEVALLVTLEVAAIAAATICARYYGGVLGRAHRFAERAETVVTAGVIAALIYGSGSAVSFFWLLTVLHLLLGAPDLQNSRFMRASHGFAILGMVLGFALSGKLADAAIALFFGALVTMLSWTQAQSGKRHLVTQVERNLLRQRLEAVLVEGERQRIARDLHDGLGGQLAALAWTADALAGEQPAVAAELGDIAERARAGLAELRWLMTDLKASSMTLGQLAVSLKSSGQRLVAERVDFGVEHRGDVTLTPEVCYQLSLMTREATLNAVKHAAATRVSVSLVHATELTLRVDDDGKGLPADALANSRGGLANLRQRAEIMGGRLELSSTERGSSVLITLPVNVA